MESMLEQILEGQQTMTVNFNGKMDVMYTDLNGKIEALNLHVKKLDTQVAQTAENSRRQEGFLPSRTDTNPKHIVAAITTRSGKTLQGLALKKGLSAEQLDELEQIEDEEIFPGTSPSIDKDEQCRSTRVESRDSGFPGSLPSIDKPVPVDRHGPQTLPTTQKPSDKAKERVYKPKLPYPRREKK